MVYNRADVSCNTSPNKTYITTSGSDLKSLPLYPSNYTPESSISPQRYQPSGADVIQEVSQLVYTVWNGEYVRSDVECEDADVQPDILQGWNGDWIRTDEGPEWWEDGECQPTTGYRYATSQMLVEQTKFIKNIFCCHPSDCFNYPWSSDEICSSTTYLEYTRPPLEPFFGYMEELPMPPHLGGSVSVSVAPVDIYDTMYLAAEQGAEYEIITETNVRFELEENTQIYYDDLLD